jgi:ribonuclease P protein component
MASRLLILAWAPNEEHQTRIGFVVSKRIAKHAVDRNYLKRRLSEAIRPLLVQLAMGQDLVLSARHPALDADLPTLQQEITHLLRRAQLLTPPAVEYTQRLET